MVETAGAVQARRGTKVLPLWLWALLIFAASRVYSTVLMVSMFLFAKAHDLPFASQRIGAGLVNYFGSWDASFYRRIAEHGYPTTLPTGADGRVEPNAWAFLPVFPWLVRGVTSLTGLNADAAGVLVACLAAAGASVVLGLLLRPRIGRRPALWVVAMFVFGPIAFVLQLPYAESLFCLLIFASLAALVAKRYAVVTVLGVIAAFTRPGALALPLAIGILFLIRMRRRDEFPLKERVRMIVAAVITAAAGVAWPFIAGAVTGNPDAYLETETSWWTGFVGHLSFVPLTPWPVMAWRYLGIVGIVLLIAAVAATAWWLTRRSIRVLGPEILLISGGYLLYLFAVFLPQQSVFRLLLPVTPLLGDPRLSQSRRAKWIALAIGIALQSVAVVLLWFLGYP
jgi:hypothetical protein